MAEISGDIDLEDILLDFQSRKVPNFDIPMRYSRRSFSQESHNQVFHHFHQISYLKSHFVVYLD